MGTDLNNVIRTQELTDQQIMFFTYQILRGLKYLHSSNIIHRVWEYFLNLFKFKFYFIYTSRI
jgi:hypothetical protein